MQASELDSLRECIEYYLVYVHVLTMLRECLKLKWAVSIHVELAHPNYNCLETVVLFSQGELAHPDYSLKSIKIW